MFDDILSANHEYSTSFRDSGMSGKAARHLAVLTCIDSRIDPLRVMGLEPGDAKIVRNAGARVSDDALRSLVLAANLLDVTRVCVMQHTDCAMVGRTDGEVRARIGGIRGLDASGWDFMSYEDHLETLRGDVARIRNCPLIPNDLEVGGFVLDVHTGELLPVEV